MRLPGISAILTPLPPGIQEQYRRHFLRSDIKQSVAGFGCIGLVIAAFAYSDYYFFGTGSLFSLLIAARLFILADIVLVSFFLLKKVKSPRVFDVVVFIFGLVMVLFCIFLGFSRPVGTIQYTYLDIVIVLAIFLFFSFDIGIRAALAGLLAAGDIFVVLVFKQPLTLSAYAVLLACYLAAYVSGLVFALRFESARRTQFLMLEGEKEMGQEMSRLAEVDDLTGIWNRRKFIALAESEVERYTRYGRPFSLMMLDLDKFKEVNDRYGHLAGDCALRQFTDVVRSQVRATDIFGRLGGEEFGILLPETGLEDARVLGERICRALRETGMLVEGDKHVRLTVSIGIAEASQSHSSLDSVVSLADGALYRAKGVGRDCVVVSDSGTTQASLEL